MKTPAKLVLTAAMILLFFVPILRAEEESFVNITSEQEEGKVMVYGENTHPLAPCHAIVTLPVLVGMKASVPLPYKAVLQPGQKMKLFEIEVVQHGAQPQYRMSYLWGLGDPTKTSNLFYKYLFPFEHGKKFSVAQVQTLSAEKKECCIYAFDMPLGTPVCAARDGVVLKARMDSGRGANDKRYANDANEIEVLHSDSTSASYGHLQKNSATVKVGDKVKAGQVIALSGLTGWCNGPILSFTVQRYDWDGPRVLPVKFLGKDGEAVAAEETKFYTSYHPGGAEIVPGNVPTEVIVEKDSELYSKPMAADNKVLIRTEVKDEKTFFYCSNGTSTSQSVTLNFKGMRYVKLSKKWPIIKVVPPLTEVYFVTLTVLPSEGMTQWHSEYCWKPAP